MNHTTTTQPHDRTLEAWAKGLPKVELHCHLDGSLPVHTVRRLAKQAGIQLPQEEEKLLEKLTVPRGCQSLAQYLECFSLPISCLQSYDALYTAAYDLAKEAAGEGVCYLEVRFAPVFSAHDGFTQDDVVRAVRDGLAQAQADWGIGSGVILCGMRHLPVEETCQTVRLAQRFWGDGVCAVDLAGDEKAYPPQLHQAMFELATQCGVPFTIHAGECGSAENVRTALEWGARRVGHGVAVAKHPEILALCREQGAVLEVCPTSNLQTKAVPPQEEHPLRSLLEQGVRVTINTDNRTVSGTDLTGELLWANRQLGLGREELRRMMEYAAEAVFAPQPVRQKLLEAVRAYPQS